MEQVEAQCKNSNVKKEAAKVCSTSSGELYFNVFVRVSQNNNQERLGG